jgi:hypothetical protein
MSYVEMLKITYDLQALFMFAIAFVAVVWVFCGRGLVVRSGMCEDCGRGEDEQNGEHLHGFSLVDVRTR